MLARFSRHATAGLVRMAARRHITSTASARADWPSHEILPLAALSPTMERGGVANWVKKEGDEISAGDVVLELETDKATLDFEAQDDSFLAKILVEAGTSDLPVGTPLAVLVEDEDDIAAFAGATLADFEGSSSESAVESAPAAESVSEPDTAAAPTPTPPPAAPAGPAPAVAPTSIIPKPAGDVDSKLSSDRYGTSMRTSTLSAFLLEQQAEYVARFGSTGLEVPKEAEQ